MIVKTVLAGTMPPVWMRYSLIPADVQQVSQVCICVRVHVCVCAYVQVLQTNF